MSPGDAQMQDVTAVIAAAGSGERLGAGGPKAFVSLAGRPMVEWSMLAFERAGVAAIVVACPPGLDAGLEVRPGPAAERVPLRAVDGGETRAASVGKALAMVETDLVAIHDAARPLLTAELIEGVVGALLAAGPDLDGAILAAPVTDTIKVAAAGRAARNDPRGSRDSPLEIEKTLDRERLWAAQTPQVFRVEALRAALAGAGGTRATDEAMLLEAAGGRVLIHLGPPQNLKVTTRLDLELAGRLLAARS